MRKTMIIGLTGPIASGKSEIAKILRRMGACVIDADEIGHELLTPQTAAWKDIVKVFGSSVLQAGGKVNRRKLGEVVFSSPKLLKKLNTILHPRIKEQILKVLRGQLSGVSKETKLIVINAAVLKEIGLIPLVDEVWVVIANKKNRIARLIRKGLNREQALTRINSQRSDADYLRIADVVVRNNGKKSALRGLVRRFERHDVYDVRDHL